ncbi:class I SAM-dependent methyltransferase [Actinomadura sp. DC4]|uniref:methyltransferase domain-containing protein n=1 Tax=Actinomadura sp. DC4 TaxID=3055069 RepID=UPI0025B16CC8|nr:class I SAM-dependent methyltransferase [Actinomadura sp. DC4]MDN3358790.1 class I SAM-dependent methyltransferase [Actinomadura sp. DC4]
MTAADDSDRLRWNARHAERASFSAHRLAERALSMPLPNGPVLDLACGTSGSALLAAAHGRHVTAVDVSDMALGLLADEARRRGLGDLVTPVHADLTEWRPSSSHALVLCTGYWDRALFGPAAEAVLPGGVLAWAAFTLEARRERPHLPAEWCLSEGEPATLLPRGFAVLDMPDFGATRHLLARRL